MEGRWRNRGAREGMTEARKSYFTGEADKTRKEIVRIVHQYRSVSVFDVLEGILKANILNE